MTLKSDVNFEEKLTLSSKYDRMNLVNFHGTTEKSKAFLSTQYMKFELKKLYRNHISWHWTVMQILDKPWPGGFKKWHEELGELSLKNSKSVKLYIDGLFLSKTYSVSARKFRRNCVSWHSRVIQNLKKNRLVAWEIILKVWLFFMWAVESLEICTLMGLFCPKHIKI